MRRKMIKEGKPLKIKLYFSNRRAYLLAYIWEEKTDMYVGVASDRKSYQACYVPEPADGRNKIGELHFYEGFFGAGVAAHEFLHAIFDLAFKFGEKINPPNPASSRKSSNNTFCEFLCGEMEYITKHFWKKYYTLRDVKNENP
jgi:hypothetical protein